MKNDFLQNDFLQKNRKGQFYLIAAILIVVLIAASATIYNYSRKKSSATLYDLGEELGIEGQNIIDYGTAATLDTDGINTLLVNFFQDYANYAGKDKNLYFLYGDSSAMYVKAYEELDDVSGEYPPNVDGGKVSITVDSFVYQFDLEAGHNFYFVVSQEIEEEKHVIQG